MSDLTHFDSDGQPQMVDVGGKATTRRVAVASGKVQMEPETMSLILDRKIQKGNVLEVARLAGIMGTKRTADLIPLCHPLSLDSVNVEFETLNETTIGIKVTVVANERTGVEMEAINGVCVTAMTIYDMCKAADRAIRITDVQLEKKSGGKSGDFRRESGASA